MFKVTVNGNSTLWINEKLSDFEIRGRAEDGTLGPIEGNVLERSYGVPMSEIQIETVINAESELRTARLALSSESISAGKMVVIVLRNGVPKLLKAQTVEKYIAQKDSELKSARLWMAALFDDAIANDPQGTLAGLLLATPPDQQAIFDEIESEIPEGLTTAVREGLGLDSPQTLDYVGDGRSMVVIEEISTLELG